MPVRVNVCRTCVSRYIFLGCKNQFSSVWAVYCLLCAAGICRTHILCIFIVECDRTPTILYTLYSSQNSTYILSIQACLYVSVINSSPYALVCFSFSSPSQPVAGDCCPSLTLVLPDIRNSSVCEILKLSVWL